MNCPFCNSISIKETNWKKSGFSLYICNNCNNKFVIPLPTNEELYIYYQNSYLNRTSKHIQLKEDGLTNFYYNLIETWNPQAKDIYEVGSNDGRLLYGLKKRGYNVWGFELSEHSAELAKKIFDVLTISGQLPRNPKAKADVLISHHVIEHIRDIKSEFNAYINNLKHGGVVIIVAPNFKSLLSKILKQYHPYFNPPDHLFYFDKYCLPKNLENEGFVIKKIFTRNDKISFFSMLVIGLLIFRKKNQQPSSNLEWKKMLSKPQDRPLPKKNVRYFLYKGINCVLTILSKPIETILGFFDLNDEIWVIAQKT